MLKAFRSQTGAVALITTIIVAVLISIITISLADTLTTEQRQTTDVHNSERAYYAADAGVEDALARIRHYTDYNCLYQEGQVPNTEGSGVATLDQLYPTQNCTYPGVNNASLPYQLPDTFPLISCTNKNDPTNDFRRFSENGALSACWNYRTVTRTTDQFSDVLVADDDKQDIATGSQYSAQADLSTASSTTGMTYIQVEWDDYGNPQPARCDLSSTSSSGAPMLETTLVQFAPSGTNATLKLYRGVLVPLLAQSGNTSDSSVGATGTGCLQAQQNSLMGDLPYADQKCHLTATDVTSSGGAVYRYCVRFAVPDSSKLYIVRLRNKFAANKYKITAWQGLTGAQQDHVISNLEEISVTGRAGDTYRRLIVRKQINAQIYSVFDFVLFSEDDLQKNLSCISTTDPTLCTGS